MNIINILGSEIMKCNKQMKSILLQLEQHSELEANINLLEFESVLLPNIYQASNDKGEPYICVNNFCRLISDWSVTTQTANELTDLEWNGNEIYICLGTAGNVLDLAKIAMLAVKSWTNILTDKFSAMSFDIVVSIDDGVEFEVAPSATIRLYTIRNEYHYIKDVNSFMQPLCIETIHATV